MKNNYIILFIFLILVIFTYFCFNKEHFIDNGLDINYTIKLDCVIPRPKENHSSIIFRNNKWLLWSHKAKNTEQGPYSFLNHQWFKTFPKEFQDSIDAAVARPTDPDREIIFFKKNHWMLWSFANNTIAHGPHSIGIHPWFLKLPQIFHNKIDVVIRHPHHNKHSRHKNELIFFSGSNWLIWDFSKNDIRSGPFIIDQNYVFRKLPGLFKNSIDCARLHPDNNYNSARIIMFKADEWLFWDFNRQRVSAGPFKTLDHSYYKKLSLYILLKVKTPKSQKYITLDKSGKGHHGVLHNISNVANLPFSEIFQEHQMILIKMESLARFNGETSYMEINNIKELYKNGFTFCLYFMTIILIKHQLKIWYYLL